MNNSQIGKLISIMAFTIISLLTAISVITRPAITYEISIYDAYPFYFWVLVIFSLFIGITILIRSYSYENERDNWIFGFLSILLTNSILLLLPLLRNYFMFGRDDVMSHIGYMKDILITGHIGSNMYPIIHILGLNTFFTSGIGFEKITMVFPLIFSIFYILSFYLLLNQIFEKKKDVILGLVPASLLLYGTVNTFFSPNTEAFLLIPFFLYSYFNSRRGDKKFKFALITIFTVFLITFMHPLVSVILILMLLIVEISMTIYSKFYSKNKIRNSYTLITLMLVIILMWQSYAYIIVQSLKSVFNWLILESGTSQLQTYSSVIAYGKPTLINLLLTVFYTYGQWIIMTLISVIILLYFVKNKNKLKFINIFSSLGFTFFLICSFATFSSVFIFGFGRYYVMVILMAVFLVSTFLKVFLKTENKILNVRYMKASILCLILLPILFFSTFNMYYSPFINVPNEQVTASEYFGMQTFFQKRNDNFLTYEYGLSQKRFNDGIYGIYDRNGTIEKMLNVDRKNLRYSNTDPIDHFGYSNYTSISDCYNETSYLLINSLGKEIFPEIFPQYKDKWRFTPEDFEKLDDDHGLFKVYDNSNLDVYFIR